MDYAVDLFIPIIGGLLLGQWLIQQHGWPQLTVVILPCLGLFAGIGLIYKRQMTRQNTSDDDTNETTTTTTTSPPSPPIE